MCKVFIAVVFMAVAVYSAPLPQGPEGGQPTAEESKAELVKAGISEQAAAGIVDISQKYMLQFQNLKTDVDNYMLTQSAADQQAYKTYSDKVAAHIIEAGKNGFN